MPTEPSLNIEDLRRVAEAAREERERENARLAAGDRFLIETEAEDAFCEMISPSVILSLLNYISSVEAENQGLKAQLADQRRHTLPAHQIPDDLKDIFK